MSHPATDILIDNLKVWLSDYAREPKDVMEDEKGCFIVTDPEEGEIDEDGKMTEFSKGRKVYLPDNFQEICSV